MRSLVWKDVVAARRLLWLVLPLGAVQLAVMSFVPGMYVMAALTFAVLLALGSIAIEEYQGTDLLWNSLPVSRGQFVAARYLTTLLGGAAGLTLSWALAQTVTRMASSGAGGSSALLGLGAHAVLFALLLFAVALYLPLYFGFGAGRALLYFSGIAVAGLIVLYVATQLLLAATGYASPGDPEVRRALLISVLDWVAPRFGGLLAGFLTTAALATGVSLFVSRRVYEARDL
ncbi:MAG TPA: ABC-2 transporter permease [Gemmatimonadota bacterium]|nr:ABC-2 transporter permease [Gemmatimonadota bacterium]